MPKNKLKKQTDCIFMLAPMTDRYVDIILSALEKLDCSRIKCETQRLGTLYSGRWTDVIDALIACFMYACKPDVHMTMEASVTVKDASESESGDDEECFSVGVNASRLEAIHFMADSRFAICAENGRASELIRQAHAMAEDMGIFAGSRWGFINLKGDIQDLSAFYLKMQDFLEAQDGNCTLHITFSVNSPTAD